MFYAISWFLSFMLLALWSVACWGVHAVTVWAVSSAGALSAGTSAMNAILVPEWIRAWIPPQLTQEFEALIASVGPVVQSALEAVPALSGAVSVMAWAIWGLGAVVLVALAVGAHLLIAVFKRPPAAGNAPVAAAR
ncbi:hypothetical protein [Acidovorax sp. sic0104]|uniref:hypothetical protein n=1 Tax=Acidovorax sp. sic0104 TaxID=2854784 RepID=UPI001C47578C|nr:hypothetical protein [Acidovorax sp. sic0104]MBV7539670.1 hypothetical protein [Acidovorax sp. sic0104]